MKINKEDIIFIDKPNHPLFKDIEGQVFNRLTVLGYAGNLNKKNAHYWWCECSCENKTIKIIKGQSIRTGATMSCGCWNYEKNGIKNTYINEEFLEKFNSINNYEDIIIKSKYVGSNIKLLVGTKYGDCFSRPSSLLKRKRPSIITAVNKTEYWINMAKEVHGDKYDYSKTIYIDSNSYLIVTCLAHLDFKINATKHLEGRGCAECARENSGFNRSNFVKSANDKKATLYILKCFDEFESFIKIGITTKTVEQCYKYRNMKYSYISLFEFKDSAENIYNLEKELHKKYKEFKYIPQIRFDGETECFSTNLPIAEIKQILTTN